jgi:hypothetical protein
MKEGIYATAATLLTCLFLMAASCVAQTQDDSPFVTKEELKGMLGSVEMTLIDMRFGRDWYDAPLKIKGAIREDPMKPGQWIDKYAKDRLLVFY